MKKLFFLTFIALSLLSCNRAFVESTQDEGSIFLENKSQYLKMTREDLAKESKNIQIWTLASFTSKEKSNLFKEKLQKIIDNKIFNEKKNEVIKVAMDGLTDEFFVQPIVQQKLIDRLSLMTKIAGFSDEEIAAVFFTISDINIINGRVGLSQKPILDFSTKLLLGTGGGQPDCNMDWCLTCGLTGGNYNCEPGCKSTGSGCGWFGTQECTQICK
ncbi:bacteriocin fulvocin C-related protein [Chryseobacterium sp.]|uniref:bacteriocin fulvocin C-related protein n=1 Tax=Chryseobacterium sp. TaxID=1871047 RepID=UPI002FCBE5DF